MAWIRSSAISKVIALWGNPSFPYGVTPIRGNVPEILVWATKTEPARQGLNAIALTFLEFSLTGVHFVHPCS
jgi:hypothetical protein